MTIVRLAKVLQWNIIGNKHEIRRSADRKSVV